MRADQRDCRSAQRGLANDTQNCSLKAWNRSLLPSRVLPNTQHAARTMRSNQQHQSTPAGPHLHVVVDAAALSDGGHDGGEVVVGQHHVAGLLGHLSACSARPTQCYTVSTTGWPLSTRKKKQVGTAVNGRTHQPPCLQCTPNVSKSRQRYGKGLLRYLLLTQLN